MLFPTHCRHVACKAVDFELTEANIIEKLPNHRFYRGSRYLLLHYRSQWAVIALSHDPQADPDELFQPLESYQILSLPATTFHVEDELVDVLNPTALATKGCNVVHEHPEMTTVIIKGEFQHLSFIHQPRLLPILLHDIAPPYPPKLRAQAEKVLGYQDVGAPVELQTHLEDLVDMACEASTFDVILPCFGGDTLPKAKRICYLDGLPADLPVKGSTLIGCKRSLDIYQGHYKESPAHYRNICPADDEYLKECEARPPSDKLVLAKCCQISKGCETKGNVAYVGWGSTLKDVEEALCYLVQRAIDAEVAPVNLDPS